MLKNKLRIHMDALQLFISESFSPALHVPFALVWVLAIQASVIAASGGLLSGVHWHWDAHLLVLLIALIIDLFVIRCIDEIKDLEYDRYHNPDRPLASGRVTVPQVRLFALMGLCLCLLVSVIHSISLMVFFFAHILYASALVVAEKRVRWIRDNLLLNFLVTHPLNLCVSLMVVWVTTDVYGLPFNRLSLMIALAFSCAYLCYEVLRKTRGPKQASHGESLYSEQYGVTFAIVLALLAASLSLAILLIHFMSVPLAVIHFFSASLLVLPFIYVQVCCMRFLRDGGVSLNLKTVGSNYLTLIFIMPIVHGLALRLI